MYKDFSLHVAQYKALFQGLLLKPCVIGPYKWNYGLAGHYRPAVAKQLLKGRQLT